MEKSKGRKTNCDGKRKGFVRMRLHELLVLPKKKTTKRGPTKQYREQKGSGYENQGK